MERIGAALRRYFVNGLITLIPIVVTIWLLTFIFGFLDGILGPFIGKLIGIKIPGLGILSAVLTTFIVGFITTYVFGKRLVSFGENVLYKLPLVNSVYSSVKQINDILFLQKETSAFRRVCAVEYPRKGIYSIGFVTGKGIHELKERSKEELINVFIPTTPSPATGFMVVVPIKDVTMLDMRLEDAIRLIVSGGVLNPKTEK
jgi:uncharacterized membrane protein